LRVPVQKFVRNNPIYQRSLADPEIYHRNYVRLAMDQCGWHGYGILTLLWDVAIILTISRDTENGLPI